MNKNIESRMKWPLPVIIKPFGQCRCCLKYGYHKNITKHYYENGVREVYRDMFLDCFNLLLSTSTQLTKLICTSCISRLNDAMVFKTMVAESEQQLLSEIGSSETVCSNELESGLQADLDNIKFEPEEDANEEPQHCSMDYDDAVDDNEPLDTETKKCLIQEELVEGDTKLVAPQFSKQLRLVLTRDRRIHDMLRDAQWSAGCAQEEDHGAVVSQKDDVSAWSFDMTVEKEEVQAENAVEKDDYNRHSAASDVREGSPPTNELKLRKNGTSETHQIVEHIAADTDLPRPFKDAKEMNTKGLTIERKLKKTNVSKTKSDDAVTVTNNECLVSNFSNKRQTNIAAQEKNIRSSAESYSCSTCKFTTNAAHLLKSHINAHSATRNYICDLCFYIATKKNQLIRHVRTHASEKPYACKLCDKMFSSGASLNYHLRTLHTREKPEKPYSCEICDKMFTNRRNLNYHVRIHTGEKPFACEICDEKFIKNSQLNYHVRMHMGEKPFACEICDKIFTHSNDLKRHARIHIGEKPFACEICDKMFTNSSDVKRHVRIHSGEKPFACKICDKKFSQSSTLKMHVRIHTGEKPFACEICDKKFTQRSQLKKHIHTGEKCFACEICDKMFNNSSDLKGHVRIHIGENPFACEICIKMFTNSSDLKKHVRIHIGEKPFACEICDKKFTLRANLKRHVRIHTGEKPFACEICDKKFNVKWNLNKHFTIHTAERL